MAVLVLVALVVGAGSLRTVEAATYSGALPTVDCEGVHFPAGASATLTRDNVGDRIERLQMVAYDGNGTQIMFLEDQGNIGATGTFNTFYAWAVAPAANPITVSLISPAGGNYNTAQVVWQVVGLCGGEGCDLAMPITETAVVGAFTSDARTYWAPGQLTTNPMITIPAGKTAWVIGQDAKKEYYKIIWVCNLLWVQKGTMGPNFDAVWNGRPLPTNIIE